MPLRTASRVDANQASIVRALRVVETAMFYKIVVNLHTTLRLPDAVYF
ncbi:MAG: hypothetical protein ACRYFX_09360 [Janthinobacterium lividum]